MKVLAFILSLSILFFAEILNARATTLEPSSATDVEVFTPETTREIIREVQATPITTPTEFYCYTCSGLECLAPQKTKILCLQQLGVRLGCFTALDSSLPAFNARACNFEYLEKQVTINQRDTVQWHVCYQPGCNNKFGVSRAPLFMQTSYYLTVAMIFFTFFIWNN